MGASVMSDQEQMLRLVSRSPKQTEAIARVIGQACQPGDLIGLDGPLGSGKTQFVRGLVTGLNGDPRQVSSPTFVLMNEYATNPVIVHVDAYRITGLSDLESAGWHDELLETSLIVVEWASLIASELPPDSLRIDFAHVADHVRELTLYLSPEWRERLNVAEFAGIMSQR